MGVTQGFHGPSDLHLHSACSDGTEPPAEVLASAAAHGVRTVALTDHDTTSGWAEAASAVVELGLTFLPGMEMSTRIDGQSVHMLAYLFDPTSAGLMAELERVRTERVTRAERMVRNIAADHPLTWADVLAQHPDGATVGRPHIADALIANGVVRDRTEAFAGILHPGHGYTVPLHATDPREAIVMILDAGGVPIMAHPASSGRSGMLPERTLRELIALGLAGFEIEHRENSAAGKRVLRRLAAEYDLIVTGSSDYHGSGKGNRPGENTTDDADVAAIIARGSGSEPVYG
ncbi:PHP domain-containing protein [Microbacterium gorillae]|uniref:PHP domain-containing protein n=1 Tax=Microbacterium gorillae TaxID=1231063 RepID=UPI00058BBF44|nr:PHP domain-containing protein [Microbacterium gorillae]